MHFPGGKRTRHAGRVALLCVLALFLTAASTVGFAYVRLQGNINQHDVEDILGTNRPSFPSDTSAGQPLNILLIGSDIRAGESDVDGAGQSGDVTGMRGDATMLVHISADRSRVDIVSIPRDLLVTIPSCKVLDTERNHVSDTAIQRNTRFNAAFSLGGSQGNVGAAAACTMQTVEAMTGIRLNGFIVANFAAFKNIVDSIGGVPMYFEDDMSDKESGLNVSAGCRLLDGTQALALARARKHLGDGSDIGRIGRQQQLVMAIINEAMNLNLFSDMPKLYKVLDAVTSNLDTSTGLGNITTLAGIAASLRNINPANVEFVTMPFEYTEGGSVISRSGTEVLWKSLVHDTPITITVGPYGQIIEKETPATSPETTQSPSSPQQEASPEQSVQSAQTPTPPQNSHTAPQDSQVAPTPTATDTAASCSRENAQ